LDYLLIPPGVIGLDGVTRASSHVSATPWECTQVLAPAMRGPAGGQVTAVAIAISTRLQKNPQQALNRHL
jgi:hypothetical protein